MMECQGLGRWMIKNKLKCERLGGAQKIKQGCEISHCKNFSACEFDCELLDLPISEN